MKKKCTFVSVWDDGYRVDSDAVIDLNTGIVSDVQVAKLSDDEVEQLDILNRQFVIVDGYEFDIEENDYDTYRITRD